MALFSIDLTSISLEEVEAYDFLLGIFNYENIRFGSSKNFIVDLTNLNLVNLRQLSIKRSLHF